MIEYNWILAKQAKRPMTHSMHAYRKRSARPWEIALCTQDPVKICQAMPEYATMKTPEENRIYIWILPKESAPQYSQHARHRHLAV